MPLNPFNLYICNQYVNTRAAVFNYYTRFVQKVSGLTTVHEVDKAYGVLTLIVFNIVPFCSYTLCPTLLSLLETFCKLLLQDV